MSRPIDLGKVRSAWELRSQGKQQKDIAWALDISLRHVQNYLSLDWLSYRGLKALEKGSAGEADAHLELLWELGEIARPGDAQPAGHRTEAAPDTGGPEETEQTAACTASERWADVAQMETWAVPKQYAPGLLGAWRRAHRDARHRLCDFWWDLLGNVRAGIPFPDAYDLMVSSWIADRWGYDALNAIAELYRLYRPWEDKVHRKVYLEEVEAAIREHRGDGEKAGHPTPLEGVPRRFLYGLRRPSTRSEWSSEVTPGVRSNARFEEMSEGARRVLSFAEEEAKSLNHPFVGTEHILMGLVRDPEGAGARVLAGLGLEPEGARTQVEAYIPRGENLIRGDIELSSRAKKLLKSA